MTDEVREGSDYRTDGNVRSRLGRLVLAGAAAVLAVLGVSLGIGALSDDGNELSTAPDVADPNLVVPFPTTRSGVIEVENVSRLDEDAPGWGGRRAREQGTNVTVFEATSGDGPVVVSFSGHPLEFEPPVARGQDVTGRPAYDFDPEEGEFNSGVPQDAPAVAVLDPEGHMVVARRGAEHRELRQIAAGVEVTTDGAIAVDPGLGLTEIGALRAPWVTPAGAVIPEVEVVDAFDHIDAGVAMRSISTSEAVALLALANRDPMESYRTAASVDLAGASAPVEVDVAGHDGVVATISSGFRALIVPDPGFVIVSNGSTPEYGFLTAELLVALGEGVEMLTEPEFERRAGSAQNTAFERAIDELLAGRIEGQIEAGKLLWSSDPGQRPLLAVLDIGADVGEPSSVPLLLRLELVDGRVGFTLIPLASGDEPLRAGVGDAPTSGMQGFPKALGGIAPAGTVKVEATVDGVTVVADSIETDVAQAPVVFISDLPGVAESFGGEHISAVATAADGAVLASFTQGGF